MKKFSLERYLSDGVENIVNKALKATIHNPKESLFITRYAISSKKARLIRAKAEEEGRHIPPFLIASITTKCNLHCAGCYARENQACSDQENINQLSAYEWQNIFREAKDLGIGFILLAGGEPMLRKDVICKAGKIPEILFPIFTNGTMFDSEYLSIFEKNRNLLPIISMEGNEKITDERRGYGIYKNLVEKMEVLQESKIFFGTSITVTKENLTEVTRSEFLAALYNMGCKIVFYVEYVPVTLSSKELAPEDKDRDYLEKRLQVLRTSYEDMVFISFPGDEKSSGGCLAAGRGFFHINALGGAEPCPFSPYSDTNLRNCSLLEALDSPLFKKLQSENMLNGDHKGGCILFEQKDMVEKLV